MVWILNEKSFSAGIKTLISLPKFVCLFIEVCRVISFLSVLVNLDRICWSAFAASALLGPTGVQSIIWSSIRCVETRGPGDWLSEGKFIKLLSNKGSTWKGDLSSRTYKILLTLGSFFVIITSPCSLPRVGIQALRWLLHSTSFSALGKRVGRAGRTNSLLRFSVPL